MNKIEVPKNTAADGKYNNCECFCEEQKKQTNLLRKIYQSLQSSFTRFRKTWISFTAIGVIIAAYSLYWSMTQPSVADQMKSVLNHYKLEELVALPDSMSKYLEVQELYRNYNELERIKLFCSDYQQRFEIITEYASVTSDNCEDFFNDVISLLNFRITMENTMDSVQFNISFLQLSNDKMSSQAIPGNVVEDYIRAKEAILNNDKCLLNYYFEFDEMQNRKSIDGKHLLKKDMDDLCSKLSKKVIQKLKDPAYFEFMEQLLIQISYNIKFINIRSRGIYSQILNGTYDDELFNTAMQLRSQLNNGLKIRKDLVATELLKLRKEPIQ